MPRRPDFSPYKMTIRNKLAHNLAFACRHLRDEVQNDVDEEYPPASDPGDPPHRRSGDYRDSLDFAVHASPAGLLGRVGSDIEYAEYLAFSTSEMDARPNLDPALYREWPLTMKIVTR